MSHTATPLAPTATRMIRTDHAQVIEQFHKLQWESADPFSTANTADSFKSMRAAVIRSMCASLEIHAQLEEEIFYPALREAGVQSAALDKCGPEHDEMRRLIARVRDTDGQRAAQDDAVCELLNGVMHHVADEETQLLPAAEKFLGTRRLSELGARMAARRVELVKPRAAELAFDQARAAPVKTAAVTVGALVAGSMLIGALRRMYRHRSA